MLDCIYQFVKNFQTLIVGLLGFSGVIFSLSMNARLSREQHERTIKHESLVLKRALRAELELIQQSINVVVDKLGDASDGANFPTETRINVYKHFIGKLGLLDLDEASAVIKAYALIDELPARLKWLSKKESDNSSPGYIYIDSVHLELASKLYQNLLPDIKIAIEKLTS